MGNFSINIFPCECQAHALDNKKTCFGVSLDGESAFEVVDRTIQTRELFFSGEDGDTWKYSYNSYQNTKCQIKLNGQLSQPYQEDLGVK